MKTIFCKFIKPKRKCQLLFIEVHQIMARKTDFECENRINSNQEIEKLIHHLKLNINGVAKLLLIFIYTSTSFNH